MTSGKVSPQPVAADARPARVICVLGMHRSGTSCLAGSLEQQGLFLGDVNTAAPFNRRGNRESFDIMHLQGDILEANGGAWDRPPAVVEWHAEHFERARGLLAEHAGRPLWGFKDPRTLLTLAGWRALVPDLQPAGIFRHPLRVAQSLASRNQLDLETSLALWRAYNERLVELHSQDAFPIVSFDDEPPVLEANLRKAGELLGLEPPPPDEPFFTDELRNSPAEGGSLPADVEALYERLRALAL
jgi:hypothetical protein